MMRRSRNMHLKPATKRSISSSEICDTGDELGKVKKSKKRADKSLKIHNVHDFSLEDGLEFSTSLLQWYHRNKRDLPWRSLPEDLSPTDKAYAVLVSEVMLQQTQVATVIPYYKKWMAQWPTFKHLAKASLNDVNEVWAGMGYYSRAKRLWEAAKKVDGELNNEVPLTSLELQEKLPGVGRYTAGAVASIAFGEKVAAVDGNVIRVLTRVRCIGGEQSSKAVLDHIWQLSNQLVPAHEPGNYNQAMMDLGATICTPKKPSCKSCPVAHVCLGNLHVQQANPLKELQTGSSKKVVYDIEDVSCSLCLKQPWDSKLGVMNFPQKAKKAPPRKEVTLVCVIHISNNGTNEYLLCKRPQGGLLAGLWEFPSHVYDGNPDDSKEKKLEELNKTLLEGKWSLSDTSSNPYFISEVPHIFSHIHQLYLVYGLKLRSKTAVSGKDQEVEWMKEDEIPSSAISTAMKKVFGAASASKKNNPDTSGRKRIHLKTEKKEKSVRKVSEFFKKVDK